jgi:hypothetical protein
VHSGRGTFIEVTEFYYEASASTILLARWLHAGRGLPCTSGLGIWLALAVRPANAAETSAAGKVSNGMTGFFSGVGKAMVSSLCWLVFR